MSKSQNFKLIEGRFSPLDATNILFTLFNSKINFHQLESLRIQERNSKDKDYVKHETRVIQLKQAHDLLKKVITNASDKNMDLEIHGTIILKPVERISK